VPHLSRHPAGTGEIVMMAGGNALWTVETVSGIGSGTGEQTWRVGIRVRSKTMPDGYRSGGTGQFESYDVVAYEQGNRATCSPDLHRFAVN
jgi:hypothetical protein